MRERREREEREREREREIERENEREKERERMMPGHNLLQFFSTAYTHFQNQNIAFLTHKSKNCTQNAKCLTSLAK